LWYGQRPGGPLDKTSAYGPGDCRLESCRGRFIMPATTPVRFTDLWVMSQGSGPTDRVPGAGRVEWARRGARRPGTRGRIRRLGAPLDPTPGSHAQYSGVAQWAAGCSYIRTGVYAGPNAGPTGRAREADRTGWARLWAHNPGPRGRVSRPDAYVVIACGTQGGVSIRGGLHGPGFHAM